MHVVKVLRKYQGPRRLRDYATLLDIGESTLSQVYNGHRRAGNEVHDGFMRAFPEAAEEYGRAIYADAIAAPASPAEQVA
jgi:hypothetical protein